MQTKATRRKAKAKRQKTITKKNALAMLMKLANQSRAPLIAVTTRKPGMATAESPFGFVAARKVVEELAKRTPPAPPAAQPTQSQKPASPKAKPQDFDAVVSTVTKLANAANAALISLTTGTPRMTTQGRFSGLVALNKVLKEMNGELPPPHQGTMSPLPLPSSPPTPPSPEVRAEMEAALAGKRNAELDDVAIRELLWGSPEVSGYQTEESGATKKLVSLVVAMKRTKEWAELTQHSQKHGFFRHLSPELFERLRKQVQRKLK